MNKVDKVGDRGLSGIPIKVKEGKIRSWFRELKMNVNSR